MLKMKRLPRNRGGLFCAICLGTLQPIVNTEYVCSKKNCTSCTVQPDIFTFDFLKKQR